MPRKPKEPFYYHCPVYGQRIFFFIGWTPALFLKYLKKHYKFTGKIKRDDAAGAWQLTDPKDKQDDFIIWVGKEHQDDIPLMSHEIVHLKNYIFKHVGVEIDYNNDEAEAYYVQGLFKILMEQHYGSKKTK